MPKYSEVSSASSSPVDHDALVCTLDIETEPALSGWLWGVDESGLMGSG